MKRSILIFLVILMGFNLFSENRVSISVSRDKVTAEINLIESEYIILNESFLYLLIESEHYDLLFNGYPDGELQPSGDIYYADRLKLQGDLVLKDGVPPGDYEINVILGFQTCDKAGICNIPVEIAEAVVVKDQSISIVPVVLISVIVLCTVGMIVFRRRKRVE